MAADPKQYSRFFSRLLNLIPTENIKDFSVGSKIEGLVNNFRDRQKKLSESLATLESNFKKSMRSVESFIGKQKLYEPRWS